MRFMTRSLVALVLLGMTLGLLGAAIYTVSGAMSEREQRNNRPREARERTFSVDVVEIQPGSISPVITTFGEVSSGRTLELRASASGQLVDLADNFREGAEINAGSLLFQTDPAGAQASLRLSETELADAQAELREAQEALELTEDELIAAQEQLQLRTRALNRQSDLRARGVGTEAALESAELSKSSAAQAELSKRQTVANAKARINRAEISVARRTIGRDEAQRALDEHSVFAEFDGVLTETRAVLGALVGTNEQLGRLIDPQALEVKFRISAEQYSVLSKGNDLKDAQVLLDFEGLGDAIEARVERVSASVGEGVTGREIIAAIGSDPLLRPGDFVTVRLVEPPLENSALIPATAVSSISEVLVIGEESRLEKQAVEVLRRQGDKVLISTRGLEGRLVVSQRAAQLGVGIRVEPRNSEQIFEEAKTVKLTPEQQEKIIAGVQANAFIPDTAKERIIARVKTGEVPEENFDRMRRFLDEEPAASPSQPQTGGASNQVQGDMVQISEEDREKMIAFIEGNNRMPADRKAALLETLQQPEIPQAMYDRITSRMGG